MKTQLAPGVWTEEDGSLHLDTKEVAAHFGIPFTREAQDMLIAEFKKVITEEYPKVKITEVTDEDKP